MGSLTDPVLSYLHKSIQEDKSIQEALYWSSKPDFQKVSEILNRMNMDDMLDEIWRISVTGMLDSLAAYLLRATNVNVPRLRAAVGAEQTDAPGDFDALLRSLPIDQQRSIKNVRAVTQAPTPLSPALWSKYYWSVRCVPPPGDDTSTGNSEGKGDDDAAHLAADIASAITANAPRGSSPTTYTVTVVFRNLDAFKFGKGDTELALLHEPNVSVQISPDPNSKAAYQAAVTLVNLHVKRKWGLLKPDIEFSLGAQGGVTNPGATPSAGVQAQIELHITTTISVTATSGLSLSPSNPGGPPDYGGIHTGNRDVDVAWTPFMIGILGHWDPP